MATSSTNVVVPTTPSSPDAFKPTIIGLYGVPGSGKSYLMAQLRSKPNFADNVLFYDGSELIDKVVEGGLPAFKRMGNAEKDTVREKAMDHVSSKCISSKKNAFITGHLLLWEDKEAKKPTNVGVAKDWQTYTHILYLNVDLDVLQHRRADDEKRNRGKLNNHHLEEWMDTERETLREICYRHGIAFATITVRGFSTELADLDQTMKLLEHFLLPDPELQNEAAVKKALDSFVAGQDEEIETVLVLDGDKTLAPCDTGDMYWQMSNPDAAGSDSFATTIFKTQGYSFDAFRQAVLTYEDWDVDFDKVCNDVADQVVLYPEMKALLEQVAQQPRFGAVVVTCGIRQIWESVLRKNGLSHVKVIGGGRLADEYVVTGEVKGDMVDQLHEENLRVLAFGDGPLDIPMLCKADEAYVVVGEQTSRSKSMDRKLLNVIEQNRLTALQIVLPKSATYRLNLNTLPKVSLDSNELLSIFTRKSFTHLTDHNAAKLLMTATRDATNTGPALRQAHENIGYYLATSLLSSVIGLEEISIPHVQGNQTDGYRIRYEKHTLIVPLMRGGEPMAFGVSKALPLAGFVHAKTFTDIDLGNLTGKRTIILVDSVINTGKSIVEFLVPLRAHLPHVRVVVVAGVVQADAVKEGVLAEMLRYDANLSVVALRKSENRYKGAGTTDTGHRLFNTTYLA